MRSIGRAARSIAAILLLLAPFGAQAQQPAPQAPPRSWPVLLDGTPLFSLQTRFKTLPPDLRARAITQRLERIAKDAAFDPASIQVEETEISSDILVGDVMIMSVFDVDARAAGRPRAELAQVYAESIRHALLAFREQFSVRRVTLGLLLTAATLLGAFLLMSLLSLGARRAAAYLDRRLPREEAGEQPRSLHQLRREWLNRAALFGLGFVHLGLQIAVLYIALQFVLWFLPWTEAYGNRLLASVRSSVGILAQSAAERAPDVVVLVLILLVTRYLLRTSRYLFRQLERGSFEVPGFQPDWAGPTSRLVTLLLLVFAAVAAYPYIPGSQSEAFKGITLLLGVLVSLSSAGVIGNVIAGAVLIYNRAFSHGDVVKIGETAGRVTETNFFVTRLKTFKNVEVSIPNSLVISSQVSNYSHTAAGGRLIVPTTVTIGYDTPWRQVHALLELAASRTEGIGQELPPYVLQTALQDFYVGYELNVQLEDPARMPRLLSDLHANIQDAFNEYGVQIMSPNYRADRPVPTTVPRERWYAPPAQEEKRCER